MLGEIMNSKRLFLSFSTAILCLLFWSCNYDNSIQPETATITGETFGLNGTEVSVNTKLVPKEKAWIYTS